MKDQKQPLAALPPNSPAEPPAAPVPPPPASHKRKLYVPVSIICVVIISVFLYWLLNVSNKSVVSSTKNNAAQSQPAKTAAAQNLPGVQLDPNKNYGDKYANDLLPVGDGKYLTSGAKAGYIYACGGYANNIQTQQGGAGRRGPWFVGTTQYDASKKIHVEGAVTWQASFSDNVASGTRTIITNDLPDHTTGVFPISAADPAYAYDRNPNAIKGQTLTYSLSASPVYGTTPACEGGQVGVMLTGVLLFNGFDAAGRDAGAWEVQDSCDGHPQSDGVYHYHTLSSCIKNISVHTVIGFALDGFPITGPQVAANNYLTSADLDECHGLTSQVILDGKNVTTYHYVTTQDFPYSVSCYRGTPIQPPGQSQHVQNHP